MTVDITYEYKTGVYSINVTETTDKTYYSDYTYYPTENKIVLEYKFDTELYNTEDNNSLDLNEKDNIQNESNNEEIKNNSSNKKLNINSVEYGDLLDVYQDEGLVIIKTKIDYAYSKKSTINQNGFNLEHIIEDNDMENIDEIQYWAVADMGNGYDEKVVSFTMDKNLINKVKNGSVAGAYIIDEASDVWIHNALR